MEFLPILEEFNSVHKLFDTFNNKIIMKTLLTLGPVLNLMGILT